VAIKNAPTQFELGERLIYKSGIRISGSIMVSIIKGYFKKNSKTQAEKNGERISNLYLSNIKLTSSIPDTKDDELALNLLLDSLISNFGQLSKAFDVFNQVRKLN
jgi:hypothetical protein